MVSWALLATNCKSLRKRFVYVSCCSNAQFYIVIFFAALFLNGVTMDEDRDRILSKKIVVKNLSLRSHKRLHSRGQPAYDHVSCLSKKDNSGNFKSVCGNRRTAVSSNLRSKSSLCISASCLVTDVHNVDQTQNGAMVWEELSVSCFIYYHCNIS